MKEVTTIILAAGKGSRMLSNQPKHSFKIGNFSLLHHCIKKADKVSSQIIVVASDSGYNDISREIQLLDNVAIFNKISIVVQEKALGSGHAVLTAIGSINKHCKSVLILYCDTPLVSDQALQDMVEHIVHDRSDVCVLGFQEAAPNDYGRLLCRGKDLVKIIEAKDLKQEEKNITLCNSGVMAVHHASLKELLDSINNNNSSSEYYLTDIIDVANKKTLRCRVVDDTIGDPRGINNKYDLANMERSFQRMARNNFLMKGVTIIDPETVYFSLDTEIGLNVTINPFVVIKDRVIIGNNTVINAFSHLQGVVINNNCNIGPFAKIRENTILDDHAYVGSFVEVKNSHMGSKAKAAHLAYLGDTRIGENTNIGAGVITCNFDGISKHQTNIGSDSFIGSNSCLVAPINIPDQCFIAAGTTVTKPVDFSGSLVISRPPQNEVKDWVAKRKPKLN